MNKSTKLKSIDPKVKAIVYERDKHCCIICGRYVEKFYANSHYIRRSQGGLGIEENIVTMCDKCHHDYDNGGKRKDIRPIIKGYLDRQYPGFSDEDRVVKKYGKPI